jgi:hypothetical protein
LVAAWGSGGTWTDTGGGVFAPEEVYFPTCLALLGYLRDADVKNGPDEVMRQTITYAEWKKVGDANPIKFTEFTEEICSKMRDSGALFGRKFDRGVCSGDQWDFVINSLDNISGNINNSININSSSINNTINISTNNINNYYYNNFNKSYNNDRNNNNDRFNTNDRYNNRYNNNDKYNNNDRYDKNDRYNNNNNCRYSNNYNKDRERSRSR